MYVGRGGLARVVYLYSPWGWLAGWLAVLILLLLLFMIHLHFLYFCNNRNCLSICLSVYFSPLPHIIHPIYSSQVAEDQLILSIAGNKADMEDQRVVSRTRAEQFAKRVNAVIYETSAKDNIGVEEIFKKITDEVR